MNYIVGDGINCYIYRDPDEKINFGVSYVSISV